jgi:hypothetical protein
MMSDGPFKSPLTKRCWQPVADRAANDNFSVEEVREAVPGALAGEFAALPAGLKRALERAFLSGGESGFLDPRETGEMESLRDEAAGHSQGMLAVDCIEDALGRGLRGSEALIDGTADLLEQSYGDNARAIEEHAQRDRLEEAVTQRLRQRLADCAPSSSDLDALARRLWKLSDEHVPRSAPKHREVDEGGPPIGGEDDD